MRIASNRKTHKERMMRLFVIFMLITIIGIGFLQPDLGYGQGLTNLSLRGSVTDDNGNYLAGANVVATHEPTGTQYGAAVRNSGQFDIINMKVGGPYTV